MAQITVLKNDSVYQNAVTSNIAAFAGISLADVAQRKIRRYHWKH
ncbi:MAG TPA: hypothetical protein VGF27_02455 [Pseudoduganella sp.]